MQRSKRSLWPGARPVVLLAVLGLTACGGSETEAAADVASLGTSPSDESTTATTTPVDTQQAWLDFAQCMRDNGVDMQDPTFDADGNVQGGFGPESGIDMRAEETRTAMDACSALIEGLDLGGPGDRGGFDPDQVQLALADYTACLRDEGLDVDDVTFGPGGGGPGGDGAQDGEGTPGSTPPEGFEPPAGGSAPAGAEPGDPAAGGPPQAGEGFDPSERIVEQLGLDDDDPAVAAALEACQPLLDAAFQPAEDGDASTDTSAPITDEDDA